MKELTEQESNLNTVRSKLIKNENTRERRTATNYRDNNFEKEFELVKHKSINHEIVNEELKKLKNIKTSILTEQQKNKFLRIYNLLSKIFINALPLDSLQSRNHIEKCLSFNKEELKDFEEKLDNNEQYYIQKIKELEDGGIEGVQGFKEPTEYLTQYALITKTVYYFYAKRISIKYKDIIDFEKVYAKIERTHTTNENQEYYIDLRLQTGASKYFADFFGFICNDKELYSFISKHIGDENIHDYLRIFKQDEKLNSINQWKEYCKMIDSLKKYIKNFGSQWKEQKTDIINTLESQSSIINDLDLSEKLKILRKATNTYNTLKSQKLLDLKLPHIDTLDKAKEITLYSSFSKN